ncbi:2-polyprenyl-6-methoxyphenol hydroxylase [Saccharopolyspora antimicrobica]|uniref:2-polyprenyl-6-methoxyphenol hydroxylase n=1 Tax=Saccharopolyspora antimicrobica TaxID=455193 RepID=A0A1I4R7D9_9PSEU|nr:FAD-dependent monooxygenase [Saccharopolyspora antimicrobica]RKT88135.1 2-polyprenyl-6-methoxyphenol hydroxylase-like FAD-dependent oxidoreductase [Saccharopolyspora antimicrobica]SFM48129.1 2-polyprenyl-6-methoxyphenol hydroxylase [Saccharopolyspora antimicrobica]
MTTDVVIVGGGPNGLMLACELSLAGIRPVVLERLPEPDDEPKANGLLGQVVRLLDHRGLHERLSGDTRPPRPNSAYFTFGGLGLDLSLLELSPVHTVAVPQRRIVQVLAERAAELGVQVRRGHELLGFSQDQDAVTAEVAGPEGTYRLRARYLVGADGAHSRTRKLAGIAFPGLTYDRMTVRSAHADVPTDWIDPATGALRVPGFGAVAPFLPHRTETGGFSYAPLPGQPPLISTTEWDQPATDAPMSLDELRASIGRVLGTDVPLGPPGGTGPHVLRRLSGGNTRVAERFGDGRVLLIGDAAHVYSATGGGPGLNLGLQDAANLGWKLAAEIRGSAPPGLLATYQTERRAAAERMVLNAQAQAALIAPGSDVTGLRAVVAELLGDRDTVRRLAELITGTDIAYDMGDPAAHPLTGRFTPELDLHTEAGPVRLAELTRTARPLLLDLTGNGSLAGITAEWSDHLDVVTARPQPGAPAALLLRPDCYVAWAADHPDTPALEALRTALRRWLPTTG